MYQGNTFSASGETTKLEGKRKTDLESILSMCVSFRRAYKKAMSSIYTSERRARLLDTKDTNMMGLELFKNHGTAR